LIIVARNSGPGCLSLAAAAAKYSEDDYPLRISGAFTECNGRIPLPDSLHRDAGKLRHMPAQGKTSRTAVFAEV